MKNFLRGAAIVAALAGLTACGSGTSYSASDVQTNLQSALDSSSALAGDNPTVQSCDTGMSKVGDQSICTVQLSGTDLNGTYQFYATMTDDQGHFSWRIGQQQN